MGSFSIWHWVIVLVVILILFGGRGKISSIMKDFGKGVRSLKQELDNKDDGEEKVTPEKKKSPPLIEKKSSDD